MAAKNKPKRTKYKNHPATQDDKPPKPENVSVQKPETGFQFPYQRLPLMILFLVITLGGASIVLSQGGGSNIKELGYELENQYPHDSTAFTQGLYFDGEFLWESTGIDRQNPASQSSIRKCELKTGTVLEQKVLADVFGEGLVRVDDQLIQLTWRDRVGYVYDLKLNKLKQFKYDFEGWGLTYDGKHLIVSDGTSTLRFLDPETFEVKNEITVRTGRRRFLGQLNELEFIGNKIYANVWKEDYIYVIDPKTGLIESRVDLRKLFPQSKRVNNLNAVLNGIAVNPDNGCLLVTGKLWPYVFEIKLVELN